GMGWDAHRTTVGTKWGKGPAEVLGVSIDVTLPGKSGTSWKVQALDATGQPKADATTEGGILKIRPEAKTVWWLLTR
ncbi:MAG: hypothetical protein ACAI34_00290, partial [Verrucomicrobium sp.]